MYRPDGIDDQVEIGILAPDRHVSGQDTIRGQLYFGEYSSSQVIRRFLYGIQEPLFLDHDPGRLYSDTPTNQLSAALVREGQLTARAP